MPEQEIPKGMFIVGNKLMAVCAKCGRMVRVDKPIFGSIHFCVLEDKKDV